MEWLDPWRPAADSDALVHDAVLRQLRREVGPGHPMFGVPVRLIGRNGRSGDDLFEVLDGSGRVAVVHLTWAQRREELPWPWTQMFPSWDAWAEQWMWLDFEESQPE